MQVVWAISSMACCPDYRKLSKMPRSHEIPCRYTSWLTFALKEEFHAQNLVGKRPLWGYSDLRVKDDILILFLILAFPSDPIIARPHKHVSKFALFIFREILLQFLTYMVERCHSECLCRTWFYLLPFGRRVGGLQPCQPPQKAA